MDRKVYEKIAKDFSMKILDWRVCLWCNKDYAFFDFQEEFEKKMGIKSNKKLCPSCSFRRLLMFRNETNIYKNICQSCNKQIISIFPPESGEKVYCLDCFDKGDFIIKDNIDIGNIDIDKEFKVLFDNVPKKALLNENNENAQFANYVGLSKNVYLSYLVYTNSENVFYSYYACTSSDIIDCYNVKDSEKCFESLNILKSYNCYFSNNINDSSNIYFSISLDGCHDCIFCSNLVSKRYYIYNKEYSKEEYEKILSNLNLRMGKHLELEKLKKEYLELEKKSIYKNLQIVNVEKSVGNFLSNSKNAIFAYISDDIHDCFNVWGENITDCMNTIGGQKIEKIYNGCMVSYGSYDVLGAYNIVTSSNVYNSMNIAYSNNILYSIGLRNKSYCILNREFSKENYKKLSEKILNSLKEKGVYGDFFYNSLTRFPYNDSIAMDVYPVGKLVYPDKKQVVLDEKYEGVVYIFEPEKFLSKAILDLGGEEKINILWRNFEKQVDIPDGIKLLDASSFPEDIRSLDEEMEQEILSCAIVCQKTGKPYRIMKFELDYYKKNNIALPRINPKLRHNLRLEKVTKRELHVTKCSKCQNEIFSVYGENENKIVYCQGCYDREYY